MALLETISVYRRINAAPGMAMPVMKTDIARMADSNIRLMTKNRMESFENINPVRAKMLNSQAIEKKPVMTNNCQDVCWAARIAK